MWGKNNLNEIGIPSESDHSACKILITSQSITVPRLDQVTDVVAASAVMEREGNHCS